MELTWKCEYCDSYNDINMRRCYVCCQARPREYTETAIYRKIYKVLKTTITVLIVLAICMVGTQVSLKIKNDEITEVKHVYEMLTVRLSNHNIDGAKVITRIFSKLWNIIGNNIFENAKTLWHLIVNNVNAVFK